MISARLVGISKLQLPCESKGHHHQPVANCTACKFCSLGQARRRLTMHLVSGISSGHLQCCKQGLTAVELCKDQRWLQHCKAAKLDNCSKKRNFACWMLSRQILVANIKSLLGSVDVLMQSLMLMQMAVQQCTKSQVLAITESAGSTFLWGNELQHSCPTLRFSHDAHAGGITAMHWSSDSQLLAITLTEAAGGATSTGLAPEHGAASISQAAPGGNDENNPGHAPAAASRVQIWHRSNWHWYLKADLPFGPKARGITAKWDEEHPLRLHLCDGKGGYRQVSA